MIAYGQTGVGAVQTANEGCPAFLGYVLVCEDDLLNQEVIRAQLTKVGLSSVIASNGMEGVAVAKEHMARGKPFDLILMDINMLVMDGITATRELAEMGNTAPVVAYSSNFMPTPEIRTRLGLSDYLEKPCRMKNLLECLSKFLPVLNEQKET